MNGPLGGGRSGLRLKLRPAGQGRQAGVGAGSLDVGRPGRQLGRTPFRELPLPQDSAITAIAHVIQLAVAPVFLLSGIGAMLAVMTNRLSRVIDRARVLEARLPAPPADADALHGQLATLSRRAKLVSRSITLCTLTALLVCAVIAILFMGAFLGFDASVPVALLFIAAMLAFFAGLLSFLREIFVATASLRIGPHETHA